MRASQARQVWQRQALRKEKRGGSWPPYSRILKPIWKVVNRRFAEAQRVRYSNRSLRSVRRKAAKWSSGPFRATSTDLPGKAGRTSPLRVPPARRRWRLVTLIIIVTAEQPIQQAAMAALRALRLCFFRRQVGKMAQALVIVAVPGRTRTRYLRQGFRRRPLRLVQGFQRQAMFGGQHGVAPDIGGECAVGDAARGRGIVIAHPGGSDIIGGETDKPGVMGILGGAGLAGRLASLQRGLTARAADHHGIQHGGGIAIHALIDHT